MKKDFVGRKKEVAILEKALHSKEAEMISVIGRRRVGKTFLIQSTYAQHLDFQIIGIQNATLKEQLNNFSFQLSVHNASLLPIQQPASWLEAFQLLIAHLEQRQKSGKKGKMVVFFDELPWLATRKSGFLKALGFFWNSWAVNQNIVIVICGSAASWMIRKIVYNKGGLHNRITKQIHLQPFTLAETEVFLKSRQINLNQYQILQLYMAIGGVPYYLKEVQGGKSTAQNIDDICFSSSGFLRNEFSKLYPALFENPENHIAIIQALARKRQGLTRQQIIEIAKLPNGGSTSRVLEELTQSGFIAETYPFGAKRKELTYRLTDEYSLFYLNFMHNKRHSGKGSWQQLCQTQSYKSWSGYAFESICLKHVSAIKNALGISGVYTEASGFFKKGNKNEPGLQIDLLIDRKDHVINLYEMKFYNAEYAIDKRYAEQLRNKLKIFKTLSKTNKQVFLTLITTFGLRQNKHSLGLVDDALNMDDLFVG